MPARHHHAEFAQHRLGLIFVDIHGASSPAACLLSVCGAAAYIMPRVSGQPIHLRHHQLIGRLPPNFPSNNNALSKAYLALPRFGAMLMQASTRVFTAAADLSNMARSALLSWISTMRSTPFAPITTGTPT